MAELPAGYLHAALLIGGLVLGLSLGGILVGWRYANALNRARNHIAALTEGTRQQDQRIAELRNKLDESDKAHNSQAARIATLQTRLVRVATAAHKEREALNQQIGLLKTLREELTTTYQGMAAQSLKENNRLFLDLAESNFTRYLESARKELDHRETAVEEMVQPIKNSLEQYDRQIRHLERVREQSYGQLAQQLKSLGEAQIQLTRETTKLSQALREPQVRGRWGELTLRRTAELAGMIAHCDFIEQPTRSGEAGVQRPDMIVRLPNDRQVVVDAKVSLRAYLAALEADTDEVRRQQLQDHARQVQSHVRQLAQKRYWAQFSPAPEFVVLFMPGEHFFSAALGQMPELLELSVRQGVVIATPTTLITLLKSVALGWRQADTAENARRIGDLGQRLHRRLTRLAHRLANLGQDLGRTTRSFNALVGAYQHRVLPSARQFEELGFNTALEESSGQKAAPRATSQLETVGPVSLQPRDVKVSPPHDKPVLSKPGTETDQ